MRLALRGIPRKHCSYVPTGRIWPSGDFSLGYKKIEPDSRLDRRSHLARVDAGDMVVPDRPGWAVGSWGFPACDDATVDVDGNLEGLSVAAEVAAQERYCDAPIGERLDLTIPANSHRPTLAPTPRGRSGITAYGRKMVKSAATLIQKAPGKRLTFATVTMPPLPQRLRVELAKAWPEFVRQLIQWLSRRLKASGLPSLICSVSEVQPQRLKALNEGYLHLHLVWPNHYAKSGNWAIDTLELRAWCSEFLQRRGLWTADSWVNVDTQRVKKTAAGYLSKYMSKGSDVIEEFADDCGWDAVPSQWWNLSKPARDLVKKFTCQGEVVGALLDAVVNHSLNNCGLHHFHVLQPAVLEYGGAERIVGWYGVLAADVRLDLVRMVRGA